MDIAVAGISMTAGDHSVNEPCKTIDCHLTKYADVFLAFFDQALQFLDARLILLNKIMRRMLFKAWICHFFN